MDDAAASRYKVGRVIESYGLAGLGDDLVRRWTGDAAERQSLRELADLVNRRVLQAAMVDAGLDPLEGEVANRYRLLTADDVSEGMRTQTRRRLERDGVDVDAVEADFVTYQAVRTYLKRGRGVDYDPADEEPVDSAVDVIERLKNRTTTVTQERLDRLERAGEIESGERRLLLELRVFCEDCGTQYDASEFIARGGCDCG